MVDDVSAHVQLCLLVVLADDLVVVLANVVANGLRASSGHGRQRLGIHVMVAHSAGLQMRGLVDVPSKSLQII